MEIEQANPNSAGVQDAAVQAQPQGYIERRAAELRAKAGKDEEEVPIPEEKPKVEPDIPKDDTASKDVPKEEETDKVEGEVGKDVLSQVDYGELNEESAEELGRHVAELLGNNVGSFATGLGSGLGKETGKLRGELREIKEENARLKAGLEKVSPNSNAFSQISSEQDLSAEETKLVQLHDYYSDVAIQNNWETNDEGDEGVYDGQKFYGKDQIQKFIRQWREDLRAIPERRMQLRQRASIKGDRDKLAKSLTSKMEWFSDKDSESSKQYTEMMKNPSVASAVQIFPDLEPLLMEAFAYTVEGRNGKPRKKIDIPLRGKKAPITAGGNATGGRGKSGLLAEAEKRLSEGSASPNDWAIARSQKYSKFFNK